MITDGCLKSRGDIWNMGNLLTSEEQQFACCLEPRSSKPTSSAAMTEEQLDYRDALLLNIETQNNVSVKMT